MLKRDALVRKAVRGTMLGLLACLWIAVLFPCDCIGRPLPRVIVMGDIHGDFDRLTSMLRKTELIDDSQRWIGQDAVLIQVGDFTDRGPRVRDVMELLMRLQSEASDAGGEVVVLLGNHEMMNIVGDLRFVTEEIYRSFSDENSPQRQQEAYQKYLFVVDRIARRSPGGDRQLDEPSRVEWFASHPLGYVEYREEMGPEGKYGKWLRTLPAVVRRGSMIFVHGGIAPSLSELSIAEINSRIDDERRQFDLWVKALEESQVAAPFFSLEETLAHAKAFYNSLIAGAGGQDGTDRFSSRRPSPRELDTARGIRELFGFRKWLSMRVDGPLWFRGYGEWSEQEGRPAIEMLLRSYETKHFVVGHTLKVEDRIDSRFGGGVLLVDTLRESALEIHDGVFTAIYADQRELLGHIE
jgi:hypothetical protein